MIELVFHKDGVYSLGTGSSVEVVAGEVVQVDERCPSAHESALAEVLSRSAAPWRKPSERTAVRFITRAALSKRHAPLLLAGIDPGVLMLDDRELLIPSVTREEWEAVNAPPLLQTPIETDDQRKAREDAQAAQAAETQRLLDEATEAEAKRLLDESAVADALAAEAAAQAETAPAGASSQSVSDATRGKSKSKGNA